MTQKCHIDVPTPAKAKIEHVKEQKNPYISLQYLPSPASNKNY
jgi:hypothetical protein